MVWKIGFRWSREEGGTLFFCCCRMGNNFSWGIAAGRRLLCMKMMRRGGGGGACSRSAGISVNFTFSVIKFLSQKSAGSYTSRLAMAHCVGGGGGSGDGKVCGELVGVQWRGCKGNGLDKRSWKKKSWSLSDRAATLQRLCCLWRICQVILDHRYCTLLMCLRCSQPSFCPRTWSLKLPLCSPFMYERWR